MKKIVIFTFVIGFLFSACNPNKDIYDDIKDNAKPYHESFDIELTDADYSSITKLALLNAQTKQDSSIAYDLNTYKSFSVIRSAADLIPAFLTDEFIALDSASSIKVKYHYSYNEYDSLVTKTLSDEDYTAIGGVVADSSAFTYNELPGTYLPAYLESLDITEGYLLYITCDYWKNDSTLIDTNIVYTNIDGTWQKPDNLSVFSDQDYNTVGITGTYLNFTTTKTPEYYLPVFLHNRYPYAYENQKEYFVYKYYDGSDTYTMVDAYVFDGSIWKNTTDKISPFINNGTEWVFDPTIHYTMSSTEDFQIVVDYVINNPDIPDGYINPNYPTTSEYYYGADSHFKNFYIKLYNRRSYDPLGLLDGLSDDEATEALLLRINEAVGIFLEAKYPDAEPVINGVQVNYAITYDTYGQNSVRQKYTVIYKCIGIGEFEYLSGPEPVE